MRSIIRHPVTAACAFAAAGLIFVACSESPTGPATGLAGRNADVVASLPNLGTANLTINSGDATVHYCAFDVTQAPVAGTFPGTDCGSASNDLTTPLTTYNPGWSAPIGSSHWIGPTGVDAPSNEYRARPGTYEFVTSFNIPTGATSIALQLQVKSDNAVVAYVNGGKIGQNQFLQDCPSGGTCNWNVVLNMNDVGHGAYKTGPNPADANVLRVDLVGTSIGLITDPDPNVHPASVCANGPQATGVGGVPTQPDHAAGGDTWVVATCLNPTGLDFVANVFWTVPTILGDQGCSPGYWKNVDHPKPGKHPWPAPYSPNQLFSSVFDDAFPGQTLLQVISNGGGGLNALGRHTVSALLDAKALGVIHYGLTPQQVIDQFNAVFPGGDYGALSDQFEGMEDVNGRTCPLN